MRRIKFPVASMMAGKFSLFKTTKVLAEFLLGRVCNTAFPTFASLRAACFRRLAPSDNPASVVVAVPRHCGARDPRHREAVVVHLAPIDHRTCRHALNLQVMSGEALRALPILPEVLAGVRLCSYSSFFFISVVYFLFRCENFPRL